MEPARNLPPPRQFDANAEKQRLMALVDLDEIQNHSELIGDRVLVIKWIREKEGSIQLAHQAKNEDRYQGKVGLVIFIGPLAFKEDDHHDWGGQTVDVGDWVLYNYSDGSDFNYRPKNSWQQVECRIVREGDIQMIVPRPDFAY